MKKYEIVGGKKAGKSGRILSRTNSLRQAKRQAKTLQKKGYSGAIYTRMKTRPFSGVHKHYKGGYKKKRWLRSHHSF